MVQAPISSSQQGVQESTPDINQASASSGKKLSKLEGIKERSDFLREPVATEIKEDTTRFSPDGIQILKFHGSYQQQNRDRVRGQGERLSHDAANPYSWRFCFSRTLLNPR